jgi:transposase-like protein
MANSETRKRAPAPVRRTCWTAEIAEVLLAEAAQRGETITDCARRVGVQPQRLFWLRRQLGKWREGECTPACLLVPLVAPEAGAESEPRVVRPPISLHLGAVRIEITEAAAIPPVWLAALVRELGGRP